MYRIEIIYQNVIIKYKNKKVISLSPDKENNMRLNITPQAFESVMCKRFCFRRIFMSFNYIIIANVSLAMLLIIIGVLLYKEHIGLYQIVGIVCCMVGLIFVNLK